MTIHEEKNVFNIAIEGNFDDCQNLVKAMFNDEKFSSSINMSGVNSINWARIVAQAVYYFYAYFKIGKRQRYSLYVLSLTFFVQVKFYYLGVIQKHLNYFFPSKHLWQLHLYHLKLLLLY